MSPEQRKVNSWLYSLNRTEMALRDLDKSIEVINTRLDCSYLAAQQYDRVIVKSGKVGQPTESMAISASGDRERVEYLKILRDEYRRSINDFEAALDHLILHERWGRKGTEIILAKYIKRIPDHMIYTAAVYCSKRNYYYILTASLQFFYDTMPGRFREGNV